MRTLASERMKLSAFIMYELTYG